jgi:hypothetical protein
MDKSGAAHYFEFSADQGNAQAQLRLAEYFLTTMSDRDPRCPGCRYLRMAADGGIVEAQLRYAGLTSDERDRAAYYKRAADSGSPEGQLKYAECLVDGSGVEIDIAEAERYFDAASKSAEGDRGCLQYGIALVCGRLGEFDFVKALNQFTRIADSNRLARRFVDSLAAPSALVRAMSVCESGSFFAIFRDKSDRTARIRLMNAELCEGVISSGECFDIWKDRCRSSFRFLIALSHRQRTVLSSLPSDLLECDSISAMIPIVFKMYSAESRLYRNVNHFLRCFPMALASKFENEVGGLVSYIELLQSSIEQYSLAHPLTAELTVYRGLRSGGPSQALLYETMVGEVIVWGGFSSASADRSCVISRFVRSCSGVLFEISLPAGAVAASIAEFAEFDESEILIAASSAFFVESVDWIRVSTGDPIVEFEIPCVHLRYWASWWDFDLDHRRPRVLV